jgi:hypothetical protein
MPVNRKDHPKCQPKDVPGPRKTVLQSQRTRSSSSWGFQQGLAQSWMLSSLELVCLLNSPVLELVVFV